MTTPAFAGPFDCDGEIYQVQSGQLRIFNTFTSSYEDIGSPQGGYNATGFNILDNFAYGARNNNVIRIHADGTIENVHNIGFNSFADDIDQNNTIWLRRTATQYRGIDLDSGAQTTLNLTGQTQNVADFAYFQDSGTEYLIGYAAGRYQIVELPGGNTRRVDVANLPTGTYGATWTDFNGRIFTFLNSTGGIYEIFDPLSSNPSAVLVAQGEASGSNDGISCNQATFPNLPPIAIDDDFTTLVNTDVNENLLVDNGNGADSEPENDVITVNQTPITQPANGTVTILGGK